MFDCFDFYHKASNLTGSARAASHVEFWGAHACSVRSPERFLRRWELNGSFAAHENFSRIHSHARDLGARANAIAKASFYI
jgi:hypothetical protein